MNVLYLAHRIPYPPNKGDKIRSFNEIRFLSREHNLYLAFLIDEVKDCQHVDVLKEYCLGLDYQVIDPTRQKLKILPYLLTRQPLSVPYFYASHLQNAIDDRLEQTDIDAIVCFSSPMAEYVIKSRHFGKKRLAKTRLIMDFVDVDSDKWRMYSGFSRFPLSLIHRREWQRLQDYDTRVGRLFHQSVFVSEKEVELFKSFCPEADARSIRNGVDFEYFDQVTEMRREQSRQATSPNILFMGAMDYYPNEDAVLYFVEEVWPHVKPKIPGVKFSVVGGKPSDRVKALAQQDPDIIVTGFVPDVRPYLAAAGAFVAPFRIARGVQNKVLEAMAAGVPVVARPEAVQGLGVQASCIRVETDSALFAGALVELMTLGAKRDANIREAKESVLSFYRWDSNMAEFNNLIA